jgi:general secretion pathway protein D
LKYAKAEDVAKVLSGMLQGQGGAKPADGGGANQANIQADPTTNSVLLTADSDTLQTLMGVVESLDIRRSQVLVEAIIVEVQDNADKNMGVQWMYADPQGRFGSSTDGGGEVASLGSGALKLGNSKTHDTGLAELAAGLSKTNGQAMGAAFLGNNFSIVGVLKMLQETSGTNILSTPNLLTTDNTKAKISVGQKVPFKQGSYTQTGAGSTSGSIGSPYTTYNREDVGITLEVTPHINEGDSVVLDIKQEVSSISNINSADGIITNQRKIDTQIVTADGRTVVLGGLIRDDVQTGATRVPYLGSIPILGRLFRTQSSKKVKTNLLVFIRATVIRDDMVMEGATAEKYRSIRDVQLNSRRKGSELIDAKSIPVLPEWEKRAVPETTAPADAAPETQKGE